MTDSPGARSPRPAEPHHRMRLAALSAVIIGVVLVAGAAFALSYSRIHHIALETGIAPALARLYPLMLDAAVVVACAAALALRGARWWRRVQVWLLLLLLLCLVAAGDAVDAMGIVLPRQISRAAVAVLPWALLLLTFALWLLTLRHARRARAAGVSAGSTTEHAGALSSARNVYVIAGQASAGDDGAPGRSGAGAGDPPEAALGPGAADARARSSEATPQPGAGPSEQASAGPSEQPGAGGGGASAGDGPAARLPAGGAQPGGAQPDGAPPGGAEPDGAAGQAEAEAKRPAAGEDAGAEETGTPLQGAQAPGTLQGMDAPDSGAPAPAPVPAVPFDRVRATPTPPQK